MKKLFFIALLLGFGMNTQAQNKKTVKVENTNDEVRIRVEQTINGKKQVIEKNISTKGLSDTEIEKLITQAQDSLEQNGTGSIKIQRNIEINNNGSSAKGSPKKYKKIKRYEMDGNESDFERSIQKLERKFERLGDRMSHHFNNKYDYDMPNCDVDVKIDDTHAFYSNGGNDSKTILGLDAYPNRPFNGMLNIRFNAPQKGDVIISITDITGKQVANEKIKDLEGRYLGQIALKDKVMGTYFLTVTQGNDGSVRRVVIE
jgi:Secretion system C-terminal sorting domain